MGIQTKPKKDYSVAVGGGRTNRYNAGKYSITICNPRDGFKRTVNLHAFPSTVSDIKPVDWHTEKKRWQHLKDIPVNYQWQDPHRVTNEKPLLALSLGLLTHTENEALDSNSSEGVETSLDVATSGMEEITTGESLGSISDGSDLEADCYSLYMQEPNKEDRYQRLYMHLKDNDERLWVNESFEEERRLRNQIAPALLTKEEQQAVDRFKNTLTYTGGQYSCGLIWKSDKAGAKRPDNFHEALRMFLYQERKLSANADMRVQYHDIIQTWIKRGFLHKVQIENRGRGFYLPWPCFMVRRLDHATTKYRLVRNAAKPFKGICINDTLAIGPNRISNLGEIMKILNFICHS